MGNFSQNFPTINWTLILYYDRLKQNILNRSMENINKIDSLITNKKNTKCKDKEVESIISILEKNYPKANCTLFYKNPFELLIATMLAAQCTDKRVNMVTRSLFLK